MADLNKFGEVIANSLYILTVVVILVFLVHEIARIDEASRGRVLPAGVESAWAGHANLCTKRVGACR